MRTSKEWASLVCIWTVSLLSHLRQMTVALAETWRVCFVCEITETVIIIVMRPKILTGVRVCARTL